MTSCQNVATPLPLHAFLESEADRDPWYAKFKEWLSTQGQLAEDKTLSFDDLQQMNGSFLNETVV